MTKISTVYTLCVAKLEEIFPTKTRIPNPYSLKDNDSPHLVDGWGITHNGSDRRPYEICNRRVKANFAVVLSREIFKLESHEDGFDDVTLAILEDAELVQSSFYERDNLGSSDIINVNVTSISPITTVFGEKYNFVSMECLIEVDYFEQV